jgi:hypothetical protein
MFYQNSSKPFVLPVEWICTYFLALDFAIIVANDLPDNGYISFHPLRLENTPS